MTAPLVMTIAQAAEYLQRSEHWVRESCKDGTLPADFVRGQWMIRRPMLDAWLAGEEANGGGANPPRRVVFKKGRRRAA